ncbi:MAG: YbaN family protein [bacterium]
MKDEIRLHGNPAVRALLIVVGWIFVALGVAGIFLPLVPTTPFLLVAAACFARGSERFYVWLLSNPTLGPVLREWRQHRTVPRRARVTAQILILVTFGSTIAFFAPSTAVRVLLGVMGSVAFVFVSRLPVTREPRLTEQPANAPD